MYSYLTPSSYVMPTPLPLERTVRLFTMNPLPQAFYSFAQGKHELCLLVQNPSELQIQDIQSGRAEFALVSQKDLLILLCKFGQQSWLSTPYQWHRVPAEHRTLPDIWTPALLQISLIDSTKDTTCALRHVVLHSEFTASLCGAILLQASLPFMGERAYEHALHKLLSEYPTAQSLLPLATARTIEDIR